MMHHDRSARRTASGFTLTEVILAIAVVAIVVPLVLALVVAGSESSQEAERETRAVLSGKAVLAELALANEGISEIVARDELPWSAVLEGTSALAEMSDWLLLSLDREGRISELAKEADYEDGYSAAPAEVTALAAARGGLVEIAGTRGNDGNPLQVFQLEVRIESPARGKAKYRNRNVFIKTNSFRG